MKKSVHCQQAGQFVEKKQYMHLRHLQRTPGSLKRFTLGHIIFKLSK